VDLLQDKNAIYLFTAYGVFLGGLAVYALSLWLRRRKLDRDEQQIIEAEEFEGRTPER
jgi:preprotein translocase subunit Sec63